MPLLLGRWTGNVPARKTTVGLRLIGLVNVLPFAYAARPFASATALKYTNL